MTLLEKPSCLVDREKTEMQEIKIELSVTFIHCSIFLSVNWFWFCWVLGVFGCLVFFALLVTLIPLELLHSLVNETLCCCF